MPWILSLPNFSKSSTPDTSIILALIPVDGVEIEPPKAQMFTLIVLPGLVSI